MINETPKVSVCVVTYNQEKYIAECLQSIIDQKVDFEYEILVGDDASSDRTPTIINEFYEKYPSLIVPILHKKNIGPTANYISVHDKARGAYICHMDGDDIAAENKLSRQAAVLDCYEDYVLAWHKVYIFNDEGIVGKILHESLSEILDTDCITKKDLLRFGMLGAHSSTMYRRSAKPNFELIKGEVLDYFFVNLILDKGNACRLEEVLGGYRVNPGLVSASKNKSLYFKGSLIRDLYCDHLEYFFTLNSGVDFKCDIFLNSLFNFFVDIRFFRPSALRFFVLMIRTFSFEGVLSSIDYVKTALVLRR